MTEAGDPTSSDDPTWTRDEIVLACDLVLQNDWHALHSADPRVVSLSRALRARRTAAGSGDSADLHSAASVSRKIAAIAAARADLASVGSDPLIRSVIEDFLADAARMTSLADELRAASGRVDTAFPTSRVEQTGAGTAGPRTLPEPSREDRVRQAAADWLDARSQGGVDPISWEDLRKDFLFEGERLPLVDQRGIRKPAWMTAALTIRTAFTPPGRRPPYQDAPGSDGLPRYKWCGDDPDLADNRALRAAMQQRVPLMWLYGVADGQYLPITNVYLVAEEPAQQQFVVDTERSESAAIAGAGTEWLRRYHLSQTRRRLHQPVFRASVIRAYQERCSVCALRHVELLDAAHIVPDRDEAGIAAVRNGMAMCKIHHAAFDAGLLGIRPDLVVQIRQDLLEEIDGPMLLHGLQGRHGERLMSVPTTRAERPDRELLERSYANFLANGAA